MKIKVFRNGKQIKIVEREPCLVDGMPTVTYKSKQYVVSKNGRIDVGTAFQSEADDNLVIGLARTNRPTELSPPAESSDNLAASVLRHCNVVIQPTVARALTPGWFPSGKTPCECPTCGKVLEGFRKKYISSGREMAYWMLVCTSCRESFQPSQFDERQRARLYGSSADSEHNSAGFDAGWVHDSSVQASRQECLEPTVDPLIFVPHEWDSGQTAVIEASSSSRLLVDAGPGTGKTAVACRRVARLIDEHNLAPANIWIVSFTRTAVAEIRNRICAYLNDRSDVWSLRIATIDAHAWAIHSGFDEQATLTGTYEENIERVKDMVRDHEGVFEYLRSAQHVIIDEAQDIVGARAELLVTLVAALRKRCGVTVFADEAQAIYGFADEDGGAGSNQGILPERLRQLEGACFEEKSLRTIHRTDQAHLKDLYSEVRDCVIGQGYNTPRDKLEQTKTRVRDLADSDNADPNRAGVANDELSNKTFILYRRRADVLMATTLYKGGNYRIRMSGLPLLIEPWLGTLFWDYIEPRLKRSDFERLWADRIASGSVTALTAEDAWEILTRNAGESGTVVSMRDLRQKLARATPPPEFLKADFGLSGPIFGTIHGCKGREADRVLLMLPGASAGDQDLEEEARVVFVGATRARRVLDVGDGFKYLKCRTLNGSRRVFVLKSGKSQAQIEFGRVGDLQPEGVAGRAMFADPSAVKSAQQWLMQSAATLTAVSGNFQADADWRCGVGPDEARPVAWLSQNVNRDLFEIGERVRAELSIDHSLRPSSGPKYLKFFGSSTLVLSADDPQRNSLYDPWATSGFVLAPVVHGFSVIYYQKKRMQR